VLSNVDLGRDAGGVLTEPDAFHQPISGCECTAQILAPPAPRAMIAIKVSIKHTVRDHATVRVAQLDQRRVVEFVARKG